MVRVVDCHAGVLGLNPGGPKDFSLGITSQSLNSFTDLDIWVILAKKKKF